MKIDNNPFAKAFKYQDRTTPTVSGVLKSITQKNPDFAKAIGRPSLLAKHNIITTVNSSKPASQVPMTTVAEVKLTAAIVQPALATAVGKKTDLGMEMDTNVNQKVGQVSQTTNGGQGGLPTAVIQNPGIDVL